jgi:hypothetical protein
MLASGLRVELIGKTDFVGVHDEVLAALIRRFEEVSGDVGHVSTGARCVCERSLRTAFRAH